MQPGVAYQRQHQIAYNEHEIKAIKQVVTHTVVYGSCHYFTLAERKAAVFFEALL